MLKFATLLMDSFYKIFFSLLELVFSLRLSRITNILFQRIFFQLAPIFRISLPSAVVTPPYAQPCSQSSSIITFPNPPVTDTSANIPHAIGINSASPPEYVPLDKPSDYFKTPQTRAPVVSGNCRQQQRTPPDKNTPPGAPPTQHPRHDDATLRQQRLLKRTSVEVLPGYSSPMDYLNEHPKSKQKQNETHGDDEDTKQIRGQHEHEHHTHIEYEPGEVRVPGGPSLRTVNSDPHLVGLCSYLQQSPLTSEHNPMISVSGRDLNSPFLMQSDSSSSLIPSEGLTLDDIHRGTTAMETGKTQ